MHTFESIYRSLNGARGTPKIHYIGHRCPHATSSNVTNDMRKVTCQRCQSLYPREWEPVAEERKKLAMKMASKQEIKQRNSNKDFCAFGSAEVGDSVWSLNYGWGQIEKIDEKSFTPLRVLFFNRPRHIAGSSWALGNREDVVRCYNWDGKIHERCSNPELFWDEVYITIPKRKIEKYQVIHPSGCGPYTLTSEVYATVKEFESTTGIKGGTVA